MMRAIRWGANDRYLGPFTWSISETWRPIAVEIDSGDDDDYSGCRLRFSAFGRTLLIALPAIIQPWRQKVHAKWDAAAIARLGRDWYFNTHRRVFGFTLSDGHLSVSFGRQTDDSSTEQRWGYFLPWTQWRHVRRSLYDSNGKHYWTEPQRVQFGTDAWELRERAEKACPHQTFLFRDFDGELISVDARIEEREWKFGEGWFKWLSLFRRRKIRRYLDLQFSRETGRRKGSWKGGTTGHSIEMKPGELHASAFKRYCAEHEMTFMDPAIDGGAR